MANNSSANQNDRRHLLIDATITAIAEYGLSKLTLAKISAIAGVTAGTVNFHFDSKESLLLETLNFVSDEFDSSIANALKVAGADPAKRLHAIINASLDPEITEHRKMAVWHAFDSESRGRQDYQRIRGNLDRQNFKLILTLCEQIIQNANKQNEISARAIANAISGITDEVWKEILFAGESYDRDDARLVCKSFLASVFPWCYEMPVDPKEHGQSESDFALFQATLDDVDDLAILFDQYRQFYQEDADLTLAKGYLRARLSDGSSVVFIARSPSGKALGFTQLYATFCSVEAAPIMVLYDLFVDAKCRRLGVGKALMNRAQAHAIDSGAVRIDLETETTNGNAQQLYETLGYVRETEFYKYSLSL